MLLDAVHACEQIGIGILVLARRKVALLDRGFDADEYLDEAGRPHQGEEFLVVCHVDRGLCEQGKGVSTADHPVGQPGKQRLDGLFVSCEIVIDDEHGAPPAG
ncbi:MAG: hypothetical protein WBX50_08245 [Candidatus Deferrimicrobiaceae bacterium]